MTAYATDEAWVVVHPKGDATSLEIRDASSSKNSRTAMRSRFFDDEDDALEAMAAVAKEHGFSFRSDPKERPVETARTDTKGHGCFYVSVLAGRGTRLAVATAQRFDVDDHRYAHPSSFDEEKDADEVAKEISERYGIPCESEHRSEGPSS